jgi:hypothetical protein
LNGFSESNIYANPTRKGFSEGSIHIDVTLKKVAYARANKTISEVYSRFLKNKLKKNKQQFICKGKMYFIEEYKTNQNRAIGIQHNYKDQQRQHLRV